MVRFASIFLVLFSLSCNTNLKDEVLFKVVGVKDGDTILLLSDKTNKTIRLANIDCPEKGQPFGKIAKQFTSDLCFGKKVKLVTTGQSDRWQRIIGIIMIDDTICLNKELVKAGLAWNYKKFSHDKEYAALEVKAKEIRIGLWFDSNPIPPWDWRKSN